MGNSQFFSKGFQRYLIIWAVCIVTFTIVFCVLPDFITGRGDNQFLIALLLSDIFMAVQAFITGKAIFSKENKRPLFYNFPLLQVSIASVIVVVGVSIAMSVQRLPIWISVILCTVVIAANILFSIMAGGSANYIQNIDEQNKEKSSFIYGATAKAQILMGKVSDEKSRRALKTVYEAFRYSDVMSSSELSDVENKINDALSKLSEAVDSNDETKICELSESVKEMVNERSILCKSLK